MSCSGQKALWGPDNNNALKLLNRQWGRLPGFPDQLAQGSSELWAPWVYERSGWVGLRDGQQPALNAGPTDGSSWVAGNSDPLPSIFPPQAWADAWHVSPQPCPQTLSVATGAGLPRSVPVSRELSQEIGSGGSVHAASWLVLRAQDHPHFLSFEVAAPPALPAALSLPDLLALKLW